MSLVWIESQVHKNQLKIYILEKDYDLLKQDHEDLKKEFDDLKSLVEKLSVRTKDYIKHDKVGYSLNNLMV